MVELENSEIIEKLLNTLINISGRKTNKGHAINTLDSVLKRLQVKYDFFEHIKINDTRYVEDDNTVSVMSDIDSIDSSNVGMALSDIIKTFDNALGKDAGYFFIKEIRNNLDDDYEFSMSAMGVDLSLMQLEREVIKLEKSVTKKLEE